MMGFRIARCKVLCGCARMDCSAVLDPSPRSERNSHIGAPISHAFDYNSFSLPLSFTHRLLSFFYPSCFYTFSLYSRQRRSTLSRKHATPVRLITQSLATFSYYFADTLYFPLCARYNTALPFLIK